MKLGSLITAAALLVTVTSLHAGTDMKTDSKNMVGTTTPPRPDAGLYAAAYGGAQFATGYGNNRQTVTGPGGTITPSSSISDGWGGAGGIKIGYAFQSIDVCDGLALQPAVEGEALYLGTTTTGTQNAFGVTSTSSKSFNSAAWFVNSLLRFKTKCIVTPYFGGGFGGEWINMHGDAHVPALGGHVTGITGSDVDFAFQGFAGVDIAIAKHWSLFTEYKFIDALGTDITAKNVGGSGLNYHFKPNQIQQNLAVAGVKYSF